MGIHIPDSLTGVMYHWRAALSGKNITFINPLTMSGQKIREEKLKEYQTEFNKLRVSYNQPGTTVLK